MDCRRATLHDPDEWLEAAPATTRAMAATVRGWIHRWAPDLTESIKWNNLCFSGRKLVLGLSPCKHHLGLVFFRGTELDDAAGLFDAAGAGNTAIRTVRVTSLDALPREAFRSLVHAAVALDEAPALPPPPKAPRPPLPTPPELVAALALSPDAAKNFARLSPSCQREYIAWVSQAKRAETRATRVKETVSALSRGLKWISRKQAP